MAFIITEEGRVRHALDLTHLQNFALNIRAGDILARKLA
jgi:hypothetical protein